VSIPVSFDVVNTNISKVPCNTDGRAYTVRGELVALPSALGAADLAVTLYLHGSTLGRMWHLPVPGYDYVWEMAKLGHVSIAIDQLGYGSSGHPDGNLVCVGGNADIAHQIVTDLRGGGYGFGGAKNGPTFDKVAIAGNSSGAVVAEVEAYSFDDVDGLIINGGGDLSISLALIVPRLSGFAVTCATGGEPPVDERTTPTGYAFTWPSAESERHDIAYDMPSAVAVEFAKERQRDPCAYQETVVAGLFFNNAYSWQIHVPVLLIYGEHEKLVGPQPLVGEVQRAKMIGSSDVTLVVDEGEGHCGMLDGRAEVFRARIDEWLTPRGF
jgi:pimeloyl-ACP methyl ester carboxylesterase